MNKAFEKILERLDVLIEESYYKATEGSHNAGIRNNAYHEVRRIVQEVAEEYNNGWIACSDRLPEESGEYLTWVEYDGDRFRAIDEIDCDGIIKEWNCSTDYKIIAWQPLPEPFKERD